MAAPSLSPLPAPGITLFPSYKAQTPLSFMMKAQKTIQTKEHHTICLIYPNGTSTPFLEIHEKERKQIMFKSMQGQEVMTIMKNTTWTSWAPEYHGMRPDGTEMWKLKLHRGLTGTEYRIVPLASLPSSPRFIIAELSIFQTPSESQDLQVKDKVIGQDKAILMNGTPVTTMSNPHIWGHMRHEDFIHVAPGIDILLALGVAWIRVDKQNSDGTMAAIADS